MYNTGMLPLIYYIFLSFMRQETAGAQGRLRSKRYVRMRRNHNGITQVSRISKWLRKSKTSVTMREKGKEAQNEEQYGED